MKVLLSPGGQLSPSQKNTLDRAYALRAQIENVKDIIQDGPQDGFRNVTDDVGVRFGREDYEGLIGKEGFTHATFQRANSNPDHEISAFGAYGASRDQSVQWIRKESETVGVRAAFQGIIGGVAGGIASLGASLMVRGWNPAGRSELSTSIMCNMAEGVFVVANAGERLSNLVGKSGLKDDYYRISDGKGVTEEATFRSDGKVEYRQWKPS